MNRDKTEQVFFEDAIGCTIEQAYQDMIATKKRFHKTDKVQGFHLVQSFAEGEVSPELAHLIGVELAERLLRGQFEVVITTHLNTSHFHNHLVWNSVSMEDGHKYHSNEQSYYMEIRKISDEHLPKIWVVRNPDKSEKRDTLCTMESGERGKTNLADSHPFGYS